MWKQKLGISLGNGYGVPTAEVVRLVKQIGFEAVSPEWDKNADLDAIVRAAREAGLALQSLHAPYYGATDLWNEDSSKSEPALAELLAALEDCRRYGFPILVVHAWIGFDNTPAPTAAGLASYSKLVEKAKEYGVSIAFENTEGLEHLEALMEHFKGEAAVGFCWDSGHEMCYNHSDDLLGRWGDRLIMTHLNDNLGISRYDGVTFWTDDLHLLPYDGVADWDYNIKRLKRANPLEYLNFELNIKSKPDRHENDLYGKMTLEEYFTEAYKRACRLAYRMQATQ
ncbi:MAG: sugar phosphate isomerase/epimerase [Clostridia bacterium]|nr:sugar phosphate isomerase/epimerase [Clostridia bacterium]